MHYCRKTRRQFLMGTGKTLLALPLLPSLMPVEAFAQTAVAPKRMMLFWFDHNNLNDLWPARSVATTNVGSHGSKQILLSSLGSASSISPILENNRYQSLRDQITIIRGLDTATAYGSAHGNYPLASAIGRNSEGNFPTIDTVFEQSKSLYPDSTDIRVRKAIRVNLLGGSLFYQKVGNSIQTVPGYQAPGWQTNGIKSFYDEVFGGLTAGTVPPQDMTNQLKSNILNRVFGAYTDFKNNRRISADDKARLDQHLSYISDLQKSFAQTAPSELTCTKPTEPALTYDPVLVNRLFLDLLATAFRCNLTKFGTMAFEAQDPQWITGLNSLGSNVHDAMHGTVGKAMQIKAYETWWKYFANQIADRFLAPLDVLEGNTGKTYIENMVTGMLCAGGMQNANANDDNGHNGLDSQQVLIGNMGGELLSGRYLSLPKDPRPWPPANMPYNCFLLTLLKLMGVPPSEYAFATPDGKGFGYYGDFDANHPLKSRFYSPLTEILRNPA